MAASSNTVSTNGGVAETLKFLATQEETKNKLFKEVTEKIKKPQNVVALAPKEERERFWTELSKYVEEIERIGIATEIRRYYRISRKEWQIKFHNKKTDYAVAEATRILLNLSREDVLTKISRESQVKLVKVAEHLETILR